MNRIDLKIGQIEKYWNRYCINFGYCRKNVRFDKADGKGYFGDIASYLYKTNVILKDVGYIKEYSDSVLQAIGVLQTIYIQQDLIDELLYLFKLQSSSGNNKKINRKIRNELTGHPISRDEKGKTVSSVFLSICCKGSKVGLLLKKY